MSDNTASNAELPHLSLIVPCYNEEECVANTVRHLYSAFEGAGIRLEIVAVDNGSRDGTAAVLHDLTLKHASMRVGHVQVNQGYGNGVLNGIPLCTADWIGIIPADGQVDAGDVVELFEAIRTVRSPVLGKVRRRFRMDGLKRKVVSVAYNLTVRALWPRLQSLDINGSPKILRRSHLLAMELESFGWFLDPEMMIKAHYMGLRVLELNVFARMRGNGTSHVHTSTCWEFLRNLLSARFSSDMKVWRQKRRQNDTLVPESPFQFAAREVDWNSN